MNDKTPQGCYCDVVHTTCSICRMISKMDSEEDAALRGMNTYRHAFAAVCPSDGETIIYSLEIKSPTIIRVEHIKAATALIKKGWHEQIADRLSEALGGDQTIIATHQGVEIETVRLSG